MDATAGQRPEAREVICRHVDGTSPHVGQRHIGELREDPPEANGRPPPGGQVIDEGAPDPAPVARSSTARPEGDPAVRSHVEVVHREARVDDGFAARPAQALLDQVRDRVGADHPAAPGDQ